MPETETLILDLDGTLVDSMPDISASLNRTFAAEGLSPAKPERVQVLIALGPRAMVEQTARECGADDDRDFDALRDLFLAEYKSRPVENTVVYPGVFDVLERLRDQGVKLGICTNKPEITALTVIPALGLDAYFPVIVCGDTLPYKKPDPRHVHKVIDLLGGDPARSVFVGDSEVDIAAADNAGLPMVLVSYGYPLAPPQELEAAALIDHFSELPDALDAISRQRKR